MFMFLKGRFRDLTLNKKLIYTNTIFVTIIVLITGLINYTLSLKQLEKQQKTLLLQNLKLTGALIDFNFDLYYRKAEIIFLSTTIENALSARYYSYAEKFDVYQRINAGLAPIIQDIIYSSTSVHSKGNGPIKVVIYTPNDTLPKDGRIIEDLSEIETEPWLEKIYQASRGYYWRGLFISNQVRYISINHVLKSFTTLQNNGILSIMVPESRIIGLLSQNNEHTSGDIFLVDQNNNFIEMMQKSSIDPKTVLPNTLSVTSLQTEGVWNTELGGKTYLIAQTVSKTTGWKLVAVLPYSTLTRSVDAIKYSTFFILFIGVLICIAVTIFIAHLMTVRLKTFTRKINKMKSNWNEPLRKIPGKDEIGQLDDSFNNLIQSLNEATDQQVRLRLQKVTLEVELLQSQINPHLLYNTLSTINWSAQKAEATDISEVTESLIRFFKHFLNKGDNITSFKNEINMIKENIKILKFTYKIDLEEHIAVEEEVLSYASLKMILQPLVENAIVHGIKLSGRKGLLGIEGYLENNEVHIIIRDNGIGMEQRFIDILNGNKVNTGEPTGYGLINVKKRIQLYFGDQYGFWIESIPNEGTTVTLKLPALTKKEIEHRSHMAI